MNDGRPVNDHDPDADTALDPSADQTSEAFASERAYLINLAFRMLGDIGAAEDAVQEAFVRLVRRPAGEVDDERGWLIVVTGRICLDQLRSARARTTASVPGDELDVLDRAGADRTTDDPADRITLDDAVRQALDVVLVQLTPAERVVFVLHDVFRLPFADVAVTVGRPVSTCRQLASRARRRIAAASPEGSATAVEGDARSRSRTSSRDVVAVTDAFIDACATGDPARLIPLLDPSVSGDGDFGPDLPAPPLVHGAEAVARRTIAFLGHGARIVTHPTSPNPALLAYVDRRLLAVIDIEIAEGRIVELHAMGDPDRLSDVAADLRRWAVEA